MLIIHTTPLRNLRSVRKYGLLVSFARQGRRAVWFHSRKRNAWAANHVAVRQSAHGEDLVHLTFNVPDGHVRRHAEGLYYVSRDVPYSRCVKAEIVRTVVEEITV